MFFSFCCLIYSAGRYFVTSGTGDLYIRSVKADDNLKKFSCQTMNKISRERKISEPVYLTIKGKNFHSYIQYIIQMHATNKKTNLLC